MKIAGVEVDGATLDGMMMTVYLPDVPIEDAATGETYVPGDDMVGALAEHLGLARDSLTEAQRRGIEAFIKWANEQ